MSDHPSNEGDTLSRDTYMTSCDNTPFPYKGCHVTLSPREKRELEAKVTAL
jgi:hypothetical protein